MKAARAVVATTPGLAETLTRDWRKAALFYARFEITDRQFRTGVPAPKEGLIHEISGESRWVPAGATHASVGGGHNTISYEDPYDNARPLLNA